MTTGMAAEGILTHCSPVMPYDDMDLVMASYLASPSHHLSQCWHNNSRILLHSLEDDSMLMKVIITMYLKIMHLKSKLHLPRDSEFKDEFKHQGQHPQTISMA